MGIIPYINASIIIQLLTTALPALEKLQKEEGEAGTTENLADHAVYCWWLVESLIVSGSPLWLQKVCTYLVMLRAILHVVGTILALAAGSIVRDVDLGTNYRKRDW